MIRRFAALVLLISLASLNQGTAQAQIQSVTVQYDSGWNLVGGPVGTSFASAAGLYAYSGTGYSVPAGNTSTGCNGYWAYFNTPTAITVSVDASVLQAQCTVPAGWSIVGNPFSNPAQLPPGVQGFAFNTATQQYTVVSAVPVGAAVWVYSDQARTLALISGAAPSLPAPTITINAFGGVTSYTAHVGDVIKVYLPAGDLYNASTSGSNGQADPLQLITAGLQGPLSCSGDPSCALSLTARFWLYRAVSAGQAVIVLDPRCRQSVPPCAQPSLAISITVLP